MADRCQNYRREALCLASDHGWPDSIERALKLDAEGVLAKYGVEMIGATQEAIDKAEDREKFDIAMKKIGLETPRAEIAHTLEEAFGVLEKVGFPCIIRPSFTMGGSGGGIAYNRVEFETICKRVLNYRLPMSCLSRIAYWLERV